MVSRGVVGEVEDLVRLNRGGEEIGLGGGKREEEKQRLQLPGRRPNPSIEPALHR